MGDQLALLEVGESSLPAPSPPSTVRSRRTARIIGRGAQMGLLGVHPESRQLEQLASWEERRNKRGVPVGKCPWRAGFRGEDCQCWWLSCRDHLFGDLGNESAGLTDDEVVQELQAAAYHCVHHFVEEHPDGATEEQIADALRIARGTMQERMKAAERSVLELLSDEPADEGDE